MSLQLATVPGPEKIGGERTIDVINDNFALLAAGAGGSGPFATLSPVPLVMAPPLVQHACPAVGASVTIATFTGVGMLEMIWITLGTNTNGTMMWDGRLQVFTDGSVLPDIDCDLGTLFLNHLDGHSGASRAGATAHLSTSSMGASGSGMSGGLKFPIPYSNGIIVKLYAPPGSTSYTSDGDLFTQVINKPGVVSNLRLRSNAVSWLNRKTYLPSDIITFFNLTNAAGWLVWQSFAIQGASRSGNYYDFLERIWFYGVDGEPIVPDGNGVVTTAFSSSGGEDVFLYGWYFANTQAIAGTPWTLVTATGNANATTIAGFDFWAAYGGLKFSTALKPGWSLKSGNVINFGHAMSWCFLYYIDTSVPFAPGPPTLSAVQAPTQITLTITAPVSFGSSQVTGYTGSYSPGGGTFSLAAGATSTVITGLTNNVAYTFSVSAVNAVGVGIAGTVVGTPIPNPVGALPTISTGTIMGEYVAQTLALADGAPVTSWSPRAGTKGINLVNGNSATAPLMKINQVNGLPAVRFIAANSHNLAVASSFTSAQPNMQIFVWKPTIINGSNQLFFSNDAGGSSAGGISGAGFYNTYAGGADNLSAVPTTVAWHIQVLVQNGANCYVSIDGVKDTPSNAGVGQFDNPSMGLSIPLDGFIAHAIFITGNVSDADRRTLEAFLGTAYNIPVT